MKSPTNVDDFLHAAHSIHLTDNERADMRQKIVAAQLQHPSQRVTLRAKLRHAYEIIKQPQAFQPMSLVGAAVIIVVALSSSVTLAAESALPGEPFYSFKVSVNENVQEVLTFSEQRKAQLDIRRMRRRLEEIEYLANSNQLHPDIKLKLELAYGAFASRAEQRIAKVQRNETAAELQSDLEIALTTHERILAALQAKKQFQLPAPTADLITNVRQNAAHASSNRELQENKVAGQEGPNAQTAAEGRLRSAQNKIAEVQKYLAKKGPGLQAEALSQAHSRLTVAQQSITSGQLKLSDEDFGGAFRLFQQAHRQAQEAKIMAIASIQLDVNVSVEQPSADGPGNSENAPGQEKKPEVSPATSSASVPGRGQTNP